MGATAEEREALRERLLSPAGSSTRPAGAAATRVTRSARGCARRQPGAGRPRWRGRTGRTSCLPSGRRICATMPGRSASRAAGSSAAMPARRRRRCARRWRRSASTRPGSSCWAAYALRHRHRLSHPPGRRLDRAAGGTDSVDPFEVADAFELPMNFVMDPLNHRRESHERNGERRHYYVLPYQGRRIWGATAGILVNLARLLAD